MSRDEEPNSPGRARGTTTIVAYGRRAVAEALATEAVEILAVRATSRLSGQARKEVVRACRARDVQIEAVSPREMQELSSDPRNDQGIAAILRLLRVREFASFVDEQRGEGRRRGCRLIALDGITNSQNVGMIVRSAVAAGIDGILWPLHDTPWINGLVIKASAGAVLHAPIVRCDALPLALGELQGCDFQVVGLAARAGEALYDHRPSARAVYAIGAETSGLSEAVTGLLDASVHIPIREPVDSLNAAVAASLVCFQISRNRA